MNNRVTDVAILIEKTQHMRNTAIHENKENNNLENIKAQPQDKAGAENDKVNKSLGENCKRFLRLFGAKPSDNSKDDVINIEACIERMCIPRRRMYDFINILESLEVMTRLKKNEYKIRPVSAV
jgi:hypothetical protein